MFAPLDSRSVWAENFIERAHESVRARCPFDRAVDAERGSSRLAQHAVHFPQGSWLIRKELKSELAEDNVEAVGWEWQFERAAFHPIDRQPLVRDIAGYRQHRGIQVEADDPTRSHLFGRQTCHDPGAASDIQNCLASAGPRTIDNV